MKVLQIICLLVVMLVLTTQSVRHVYVMYFESTASVLHKYDKDTEELRKQIEKAGTLAELDAMYAPARKITEALDAQLRETRAQMPKDERSDFENSFRNLHEKEYQRESMLREAISDWEGRTEQIRELRVFWAFGLGIFVIGGLVYLRAPWLGMSLLIPGVVEMIWWSSPSFRFAGSPLEFERLLFNKLVFTNITLVLFIAGWLVLSALTKKRAASAP